jgi:hypothetical protein
MALESCPGPVGPCPSSSACYYAARLLPVSTGALITLIYVTLIYVILMPANTFLAGWLRGLLEGTLSHQHHRVL